MLLLGGCVHPVAEREEVELPPKRRHAVRYAALTTRGREPAKDDVPCHLQVMLDQVGVTERTGKNDGHEVEQYLASVGLGAGHPWCAALPHWSYRSCGRVMEPAREFAMARRWHTQERRTWERSGWTPKPGERLSRPGDHLALYYANLGRIGHTAVVEAEDDDYFSTVEGNTNAEGSREGNGVHRRRRLKRSTYCLSRWD